MREDDKSKYVNPFDPVTELKYYRDYKNTMDTAVYETKIKIAKSLKDENIEIEFIVEVTELSKEEIEKL